MTAKIDNAELMSLLESSDIHTVNEVRTLIQDQLSKGKEVWLVNTVVDSFVESNSTRCLELLAELKEPHDKHLFDRMLEHWKTGNRIQVLMIFGHLVRREPSWLQKIVAHQLLQLIIKNLKAEGDTVTLLTGALTVTALLPVVPSFAVQIWTDVCELFGRLVVTSHNKTGSMRSGSILQCQVATNIMFNRLYGMYPCHFLTYLRSFYGRQENAALFTDVIKPLLYQVRVHPLLITATKDKETMRDRWKNKDVHDIIVDCAQLSLDLMDNGPSTFVALVNDHSQHVSEKRRLLVKKASFDIANAPSVVSSTGWSPSNECGLSTPPPSKYFELKPSPLILPASGTEGTSSDSPMPLTPFTEQNTPKLAQANSFDFSRAATSGNAYGDDSALDLSGRFVDGLLAQKTAVCLKCDAATQTTGKEVAGPLSINVKLPAMAERPTFLENSSLDAEDSDTSGSPQSGVEPNHMTSAMVAAFVKKVKRIRFNSITVVKDSNVHSTQTPPKSLHRSSSCPVIYRLDSVSESDATGVLHDSPKPQCAAPVRLASPVISFRSAQASPVTVKESVATQTVLYFNGCESPSDLNSGGPYSGPYELLATLTVPFAPFLQCYACLHRSIEIEKTGNRSKTWSSSPVYMSRSPQELLDHYLDQCVSAHSYAIQAKQSPSVQTSPESLLTDVRLLHVALLFERHKRNVYGRRNSQLLSQISHLTSLREQNDAIRDQLSLQEVEMKKSKVSLLKEQQTNIELRQSIECLEAENKLQLRDALVKEEEWKSKVAILEDSLKQLKADNDSLVKDLDSARHALFLKDIDIELLQRKADGAKELIDQVSQLNIELMMMGELHQKYQQRLAETADVQTADYFKLRSRFQSSTDEANDAKNDLKQLKIEFEAASAKICYLDEQLKMKDLLIQDQKQLLEQTKLMNHTERQGISDKLKSSLKQQHSQQQRIFELESELAVLRNSHSHHRFRQSTNFDASLPAATAAKSE